MIRYSDSFSIVAQLQVGYVDGSTHQMNYLYTVIFFTQKIATTVSSVLPAKLTQFSEVTTTKGVKWPKKLKKGQKFFEGQKKGRIW